MNQDLKDYIRSKMRDIAECTECELSRTYSQSLRQRNVSLTIDNVPEGALKCVILAESPPKSTEFFYNLGSDGRGWLGRIIFCGFGLEVGDAPLVGYAKKMRLDDLKLKGVLMLDSCQCACNHLAQRGSPARKEEKQLRKDLVLSCYRRHACHVIDRIMAAYPTVYVLPTFPGGYGWNVVGELSEHGFRKMDNAKRIGLLPGWERRMGLRYREFQ